jgi:steroid delta-isomerase-like uncharacterized protein
MSRLIRSSFAIAILLTIMGCNQMSSLTSPQQIRHLVNELYAAWSLHEPDRIDAIFTDDAAYEDVAGGQVLRGKLEIKQLLRAAFAWAPDFRVTMTSLTIAGDTGTTEWVIEGTQTGPVRAGPFGELPATGRTFRLRGASILVFRGGRIAKVTDYYDMATFLRELGATVAAPNP